MSAVYNDNNNCNKTIIITIIIIIIIIIIMNGHFYSWELRLGLKSTLIYKYKLQETRKLLQTTFPFILAENIYNITEQTTYKYIITFLSRHY